MSIEFIIGIIVSSFVTTILIKIYLDKKKFKN